MDDVLRFASDMAEIDLTGPSGLFFRAILEVVDRVIPSHVSLLWLHDSETKQLALAALRSPQNETLALTRTPLSMSTTDSLVAQLLRDGQPRFVVANNVNHASQYRNRVLASEFNLQQVLIVAVTKIPSGANALSGDIVAVLELFPRLSLPVDLETHADFIARQIYRTMELGRLQRRSEVTSQLISLAERDRSFDDYLASVAQLIANAVDARDCSIFLFDEERQHLQLFATTSQSTAIERHAISYQPGEGLTGQAFASGRTLKMRDATPAKTRNTCLDADSTVTPSVLAVPIMDTRRRPVGVLRCVGKGSIGIAELAGAFSTADQDISELAASIVGFLYENRRADIRMQNVLQDISHEVRTPLSGILGRAANLQERAARSTLTTEYLAVKLGDIVDMAELVTILIEGISVLGLDEHILTSSRSLLFSSVVIKWCKLLEPVAQQKKMTISWTNHKVIPPLYVNPRILEQAVFNLLSNAIKYGHNGTAVEVEAVESDNAYMIVFRDWGIEIPPAQIDVIFLKGFRGKEAISKSPIGKGLGLAIAKKSVEMQGGYIQVIRTSMPTEVAICLPKDLAERPYQ